MAPSHPSCPEDIVGTSGKDGTMPRLLSERERGGDPNNTTFGDGREAEGKRLDRWSKSRFIALSSFVLSTSFNP